MEPRVKFHIQHNTTIEHVIVALKKLAVRTVSFARWLVASDRICYLCKHRCEHLCGIPSVCSSHVNSQVSIDLPRARSQYTLMHVYQVNLGFYVTPRHNLMLVHKRQTSESM